MCKSQLVRRTRQSEAEVADEVELVSDGDGLVVVGDTGVIERFMEAVGFSAKESIDLATAYSLGAGAAEVASLVGAQSGRWVKLTAESAEKVKKFGLMATKDPGIKHAMVGNPGKIKSWLQVTDNLATPLSNPLLLANAAALMSQLASQQQMKEIEAYLEAIDAKVDQVLRTQLNQALARLDGVDLAIREARTVREAVGRISDITWSKVQAVAQTIFESQGFALRELADISERVDLNPKISDLESQMKTASIEIQKWLAVLARCVRLAEAVGILELDRVMTQSPEDLERHRVGLRSARHERNALIAEKIDELFQCTSDAAARANARVLANPIQSPSIIASCSRIAAMIIEFLDLIEVDSEKATFDARSWRTAANEGWINAKLTGAHGVDGVKRLTKGTTERAASATGKLAERIADRVNRRSKTDE